MGSWTDTRADGVCVESWTPQKHKNQRKLTKQPKAKATTKKHPYTPARKRGGGLIFSDEEKETMNLYWLGDRKY